MAKKARKAPSDTVHARCWEAVIRGSGLPCCCGRCWGRVFTPVMFGTPWWKGFEK